MSLYNIKCVAVLLTTQGDTISYITPCFPFRGKRNGCRDCPTFLVTHHLWAHAFSSQGLARVSSCYWFGTFPCKHVSDYIKTLCLPMLCHYITHNFIVVVHPHLFTLWPPLQTLTSTVTVRAAETLNISTRATVNPTIRAGAMSVPETSVLLVPGIVYPVFSVSSEKYFLM